MTPLEDLRVIAVEQFGAGPFGSVQLADLGAEVIKIEDPRTGGDVGRYVGPHQEGEDSLFYQTFNRNKRSVSLDLNTSAGRAVFEELVSVSDVVFSNLRGDVPARLRIRYDDLAEFNERIVCVSLSGYGMDGSRSKRPGYDYMFQGETGWMSLTGERDGPPAKSGLSLVDFSAGYVAAMTVLAGVHAARRDGVGMDCDLSLYDVAVNLLTYPATWYLTAGEIPKRFDRSSHPSLVPFQNFPTATNWMVVGCAKDKFWERLVAVIDRPALAEDTRFATFETRREHQESLVEILDEEFRKRPAEEWLAQLEEAGVPCAPIRTVPEALDDPFIMERGMVVETAHPLWGSVKQVSTPANVGDMSALDYRRAPARNEDSRYVFDLMGYDEAKIDRLAAEGAFGQE
jgi:crotonobetainyl-CoA:carnitine CoA-transferase CaiB-like acyl-CoA transferase